MSMLSIVIPAYQAERTLPRCLRSVCALRCTDLEVLVVNDGSTDKTGEICQAFAREDGRLRVIDQGNQGRCVARNHALDEACGSWVMFVDADDEVVPECIDAVCEALASGMADDVCDIVQLAHVQIEASAQERGRGTAGRAGGNAMLAAVPALAPPIICAGREVGLSVARNGVGEHPVAAEKRGGFSDRAIWGKLYSRRLVGERRFVPGLRFGEDALFNLQCYAEARIAYVGSVAYLYHLESGATCSKYHIGDFPSLELAYAAALPLFEAYGLGEGGLRPFIGLDAYYRLQLAAENRVSVGQVCAALAQCPCVRASLSALMAGPHGLPVRNKPALALLAHGHYAGAYEVTCAVQAMKRLLKGERQSDE